MRRDTSAGRGAATPGAGDADGDTDGDADAETDGEASRAGDGDAIGDEKEAGWAATVGTGATVVGAAVDAAGAVVDVAGVTELQPMRLMMSAPRVLTTRACL